MRVYLIIRCYNVHNVHKVAITLNVHTLHTVKYVYIYTV